MNTSKNKSRKIARKKPVYPHENRSKVMEVSTHTVDSGQLLRQMHHYSDDQRISEGAVTHQ